MNGFRVNVMMQGQSSLCASNQNLAAGEVKKIDCLSVGQKVEVVFQSASGVNTTGKVGFCEMEVEVLKGCYTTGTGGGGGGNPCHFPFTWKGIEYSACTTATPP